MNHAANIFRDLVLDQAAVVSLVVARVYEGVLPKSVTLPAITYDVLGGEFLGETAVFQQVDIVVRCFASTRAGAHALYGALFDGLNSDTQHTLTGGEVVSGVAAEGSELLLIDPDLEPRAFYAQGQFSMVMST